MPSLVGTSTDDYATALSSQRKTFFAKGRFWVFYCDGSNLVYVTSRDGVIWTSSIVVRTGLIRGSDFSIWFDGTFLHYAFASASPIYYRRGTPNSDGSITWSAGEQTVGTTYNYAAFPFVSVDSNRYVWVGYRDWDIGTGKYYPYVIKSGRNNGTWGTTPSPFPFQLSTISAYWVVSPIPLTQTRMLTIYCRVPGSPKSRVWDGSAFGPEKSLTSGIQGNHYYSAVAEEDYVHLVFLKGVTYDMIYSRYTYALDLWSIEQIVLSGLNATSAPILTRMGGILYLFWAGAPTAQHIYHKKREVDGSWTDSKDWISETNPLTENYLLTGFYEEHGGKLGLLYMTELIPGPYNLKFGYVTTAFIQYSDGLFCVSLIEPD